MKTNYPSGFTLLKNSFGGGHLLRRRLSQARGDGTIQIGGIFQASAEIIFRGHPSRFCLGKAGFWARKNLFSGLG